jgi:hypothetical protein
VGSDHGISIVSRTSWISVVSTTSIPIYSRYIYSILSIDIVDISIVNIVGYHGISWDDGIRSQLHHWMMFPPCQKVGPAMDPELLDPRTGMVTTNRPVDHRRSCLVAD